MKIKGWNKLILQILILSATMFILSFIVEIEFVKDLIFEKCNGCGFHSKEMLKSKNLYHVNFRGGVYYITGFVLFVISIIRIVMSHKEKDFY